MSSSLSGKLSVEIDAKSPARAFYEALGKRLYDIPKRCPISIPKVDLVEGKWEDVGAVVNFHLAHGGKTIISKEIVESLDDEKLSVTFNLIGGVLVEGSFKSFKFIFQAIPKKEGCLGRWTCEYEKLNAGIPDPKELVQFAGDLTREIDDTLMKSQA
ncbi:hypothetical protein F2P56_030738 [Juglans regia]|uniref:MLP-like protein 43 n=2 Tax=Juglans regia TaxID=51240 RepID=A0A2I4EZ14_JUGRE|nr:MLP-like protein 43 [Juglans regia]KAF5450380.1 hypothetical protein F2P56_030738 [Juglans regia]